MASKGGRPQKNEEKGGQAKKTDEKVV